MNLKKYLPFENCTLVTDLSRTEVDARLKANIEPKGRFITLGLPNKFPKPYEGQIAGQTFTISRIINYRNSFLPVIKGHISISLSKTHIAIKMKLVSSVMFFLILWLSITGLAFLAGLAMAISRFKQQLQYGFPPMIWIPLCLLVFISLLTSISFKMESNKSKEFLATLLEGQYLEETG